MKPNSNGHTHNAVNPDQARKFRNQATGVGQRLTGSEMTGACRSQRVADCMPAEQRVALVPNAGYPEATPIEMLMGMTRKGY